MHEPQPTFRRITLQTADPAALFGFYAAALNLPANLGSDGTLTVHIGATDLVFTQAPPGAQPFYHFAFNIAAYSAKEFTAAKKWLASRTPLIRAGKEDEFEFEAWNARAIYFKDPAGNIGEFIARSDLAGTPNMVSPTLRHAVSDDSSTFSFPSCLPTSMPSRLTSVSEIGLVVDDVIAAAEKLRSTFNMPHYPDPAAPFSEDFAAFGSPHALFILVREGRAWYPQNTTPAAVFPVTVELAMPGDQSGSRNRRETVLQNGAYRIVTTP